MDKKTVSLILEQNLDTVKSFIHMMLKEFKDEVEKVKEENRELKRSLEFSQSEVAYLKDVVKKQSEDIKSMQRLPEELNKLDDRVRVMDDALRKNNLRFEGIPESNNENYEQSQAKIQSLISEKLDLNIKLESANRIGNRIENNKPRPIIARLSNFSDRQKCLRAAYKLKGSNVYINDDVSRRTIEIRNTKMEELKEKRRQGYIAYFSGSNLIVKKRQTANSSRSTDVNSETTMNPATSIGTVPIALLGAASAISPVSNLATSPGVAPVMSPVTDPSTATAAAGGSETPHPASQRSPSGSRHSRSRRQGNRSKK